MVKHIHFDGTSLFCLGIKIYNPKGTEWFNEHKNDDRLWGYFTQWKEQLTQSKQNKTKDEMCRKLTFIRRYI